MPSPLHGHTIFKVANLLITVLATASCGGAVAEDAPSLDHRMNIEHSVEVEPNVICDGAACTLRVAVTSNGETLLSDPLPFSSLSPEVELVAVDDMFGAGAFGDRAVTAWAIGTEEQSVGLAVERIAIGSGEGLIAHQIAGYEHIKRSHMVLEITSPSLTTHFKIVEGVGPEVIDVRPNDNGIIVSRRFDAGQEQLETYRWVKRGGTPSLVPTN